MSSEARPTGESAAAQPSRLWMATPAIMGLLVALVCGRGYFELAEDLALSPKIAAFDAQVNAIIQSWRGPALTWLFRAATWTGNTLTITALVAVAVAVLVWHGYHREAVLIALVVGVGMALGTLAKRVVARPRPPAANAIIELPTSYSFPSGHTLGALLFWTLVVFIVFRVSHRRWVRALAIVGGFTITVLVALSRVYLGVHWPSDILASWLLGTAWLSLTLGCFVSWERAWGGAVR